MDSKSSYWCEATYSIKEATSEFDVYISIVPKLHVNGKKKTALSWAEQDCGSDLHGCVPPPDIHSEYEGQRLAPVYIGKKQKGISPSPLF